MPVRAKYHFDNVYDQMRTVIGPYILYQAGDLYCNPGYRVPPHTQIVDEITCVVSGSGVSVTDGISTPLKPGMIYLNGEGETHAIEASDDEPLRYFYLGFRFAEPVSPGAMGKLKAFFDRPAPRYEENIASIQDAFIGLLSQFIYRDILSETLTESYMHQIVCGVYRLFHHCAQYTYLVNEGSAADERLVYDVAHYLDAQVGGIDHLRSLGKEFGYSYAYISQKFSKVTGRSLKAYYTSRRFKKARDYLAEGMRVTTVSELMGYRSIHSFSNAFKKEFGLCPSDYQKKQFSDQEKNIPEEWTK
jgi:AraC-like DNA-binding protein/mannose-6-phosphate isomerase-like protein (cupin superfamily)